MMAPSTDVLTFAFDSAVLVAPSLFGAGVAWGFMRGSVRQLREEIAVQSKKIDELDAEQRGLALRIAAVPTRDELGAMRREIVESIAALDGKITKVLTRGIAT